MYFKLPVFFQNNNTHEIEQSVCICFNS